MLLALPPNQNGYRIGFFFSWGAGIFFSASTAAERVAAVGCFAASMLTQNGERVIRNWRLSVASAFRLGDRAEGLVKSDN